MGIRVGKRTRDRLAAAVAVTVAAATGATVVSGQAAAKPIAAPADFNGDGYRDVVVPAPMAKVGGKDGAGVA
ncbi:hypothetical protein GCM10022207_06310 [Streptomyces lannensis]|uniref:VCBS repeat-containing protein n=1 Tax=Streptomyces lannensis TaxID=766498 RepID=A0ABP7JMP6_9ACTN